MLSYVMSIFVYAKLSLYIAAITYFSCYLELPMSSLVSSLLIDSPANYNPRFDSILASGFPSASSFTVARIHPGHTLCLSAELAFCVPPARCSSPRLSYPACSDCSKYPSQRLPVRPQLGQTSHRDILRSMHLHISMLLAPVLQLRQPSPKLSPAPPPFSSSSSSSSVLSSLEAHLLVSHSR